MSSSCHSKRPNRKSWIRVSRFTAFILLNLLRAAVSSSSEPFNPVPYEAQRQTVELGRAAVFQTTSDFVAFRVANPQFCSAEVIGNDRKALAVTGLMRGTTTVTVWFNRPTSTTQTYVVSIVTAPDAYVLLERFIAQQFPRSSIKLTPVPTSQKVVVSGTACSCSEWQQIVQLIDGSGLGYRDLIVRVTIPYCFRR